ncbi:MAG: peptidylprolyl isomerase [Aeoliella sp.]
MFFALTLILFAAAAHAQAPPAANSPQRMDECQVVARIDNQIILACEVMWEANLIISENIDQIPPERVDEAREQLMQNQLRGLVDLKLLYADFRRNAPGADLDGIRKQLEEPFYQGGPRGDAPGSVPALMKAFGAGSVAELEQKLLEMGTSVNDRRDAFVEQAIARQWMKEKIQVDKPAHHDLVEYFQEHLSEYEFPTQAKWEELEVRFDKHSSKEAAHNKLAEAGNLLWTRLGKNPQAAGPQFGDVAPNYSDGHNAKEGGLYDWTSKGALRNKEIDKALFSLPVGALSPIIESETSLHIVRVIERHDAGHTPFHEVQDELREKIMNENYAAETKKLISKLRRETRIWTIYTGDTTAEAFLSPPGAAQRR